MKNSALGLIETYGYVSAVEAADAALKAADVKLVNLVKVRGGIMTLTLEGEVAAVKAAVDAGAASAERIGRLLTSHVIARLDEEVWAIVETGKNMEQETNKDPSSNDMEEEKPVLEMEKKPSIVMDIDESLPVETSPEEGEEKPTEIERDSPKEMKFSVETMMKLKVEELRRIARSIKGVKIPKNEIKFANKATLVKEISEAQERRSKE